ncbi:MAG: OmpH family outer membrane protein [Candidatus Omnitrophota bacterium]
MKNLKIFLATVIILGFAAGGLCAQEAMRFAYVDLSRLFDEYYKTKEYDEILSGKAKVKEEERGKIINVIKDLQAKLALVSDKEKDKLQSQLDAKMKSLEEFDREATADLRKQRDELLREVLKDIEKVVRDYAQKEKYDFIFNDRILLYGDDGYDITQPLIKILNEKAKKK